MQKRSRSASGEALWCAALSLLLASTGASCSESFSSCEETRTCPGGAEAGGRGGAAGEHAGGLGGDALGGAGGPCADEAGGQCGSCAGESCADAGLLSSIEISGGKLEPAFSPEVYRYRAVHSAFRRRLTVEATAGEPATTILLDGTRIESGASSEVDIPVNNEGSATFEAIGTGGDVQTYRIDFERAEVKTSYLKSEHPESEGRFGASVAVSGDVVVVGEPGAQSESGETRCGSTTVFTRKNRAEWTQQARLLGEQFGSPYDFGWTVAVDGNLLAAAGNVPFYSRVLTFSRDGETWRHESTFKEWEEGEMTYQSGALGYRIALQGQRLLASAPEGLRYAYLGGYVTAYIRMDDEWQLDEHEPLPDGIPMADTFGYGSTLDVDGDRAVVGSYRDDLFVLNRGSNGWEIEATIDYDEEVRPSVRGLQGDTLVVSTKDFVEVLQHADGEWRHAATLKPFDDRAEDGFGTDVALDGELIAVSSACSDCVGGVSTFARVDGEWVEDQFLEPEGVEPGAGFGWDVDVSGDTIVVSAEGEDGSERDPDGSPNHDALDSGAVFVFE